MQIHERKKAVLDAMSYFDGIWIVHDWQNERRRMRSKWSDSFCSLSVFNERRTNPIECTSSSPVSSMSSSDSLYRIPNGMFCSLRSYLLSIWWIVCRELLLFISCLILLHLLLHNDLDRNPLSCPTVHVALSTAVCLLLSCIPNSVWWPGHSCLWFLSHCCSPTCRIACWVYYLHTCCCIHLLLSVLGSILFLNNLEMEWDVQQHPHGENIIEAVNTMSEMMLIRRILQCRNDVGVVVGGVWVVRHGFMAVWRHSGDVGVKLIEWFVFPSWWASSRVTGMKCKEEQCVEDAKRSSWWPTGKWCVFVFVICKERSVETNGSSLVVIVCW